MHKKGNNLLIIIILVISLLFKDQARPARDFHITPQIIFEISFLYFFLF